jgi:hypothetical protein
VYEKFIEMALEKVLCAFFDTGLHSSSVIEDSLSLMIDVLRDSGLHSSSVIEDSLSLMHLLHLKRAHALEPISTPGKNTIPCPVTDILPLGSPLSYQLAMSIPSKH